MKALDIIEEIKNKYDVNHDFELLSEVEKLEKAVKIINKYLLLDEYEDIHGIFHYRFVNNQYAYLKANSSMSNNIMCKEEYELLKEILVWL